MPVDPSLGIASLLGLAAVAALLAAVELHRYRADRAPPHLYWGFGLALVAVTVAEEAVFYAGVWSVVLAESYYFLVAVLVGVLSLGSTALGVRRPLHRLYAGYVLATSALVGLTAFSEPVARSVLTDGVMTGNPPVGVLLSSVLVTVPAAVLMVGLALLGAWRRRTWPLLLVAAGIIVISVAGALYLASVPITLYYAEFVGVALLFLGFRFAAPGPHPAAEGSATITSGG